MANPCRGEAKLYIGGRERIVAFDFNSLADLEDVAGISFLNSEQLEQRVGLRFIRDALSIGLSSRGPKVTPRQVGTWLSDDPAIIGPASMAVQQAIKRFFVGSNDDAPASGKDGEDQSDPPVGTEGASE